MLTKSTERLNGHCGECCSRTCCPLRAYRTHTHARDPSAHVYGKRSLPSYDLLLCVSFILCSDVRVVPRRVFIVKRAHTCEGERVCNDQTFVRRDGLTVTCWGCFHDAIAACIQYKRALSVTQLSVQVKCIDIFRFIASAATNRDEENQKQTSSNTRFDGDSDAGGFLFSSRFGRCLKCLISSVSTQRCIERCDVQNDATTRIVRISLAC